MIKVYSHLEEILTLSSALKKDGRNLTLDDLSILKNASIVFDEDQILWVGATKDLPSHFLSEKSFNLSGHCLTPGLVDSHTHLLFGGDRSLEYTQRLSGKTYQEIASEGGGILLTMKQTNALSREEVLEVCRKRIKNFISFGVKLLEIKSGYGLNLEKEVLYSRIISELKNEFRNEITIKNTCMVAHDVPPGFSSSRQYMDQVVKPTIEKLLSEDILDFVDIFHEKNYFSSDDVREVARLVSGSSVGLRLHADELNDNDGAALATELNASSADHLLQVSDRGISALSQSSTVATLLPGTALFLGKSFAPSQKMLKSGVKLAIASDYNPGSCHFDQVLQIASMTAAPLKLNLAQLWSGITLNPSHSLNEKKMGAIVVGHKPCFTLFKAPTIATITYEWGKNLSVTEP